MSAAAEPAASVVVLNHNGRRYLDACLRALLAQECPGGFEVLLVDNDSTDGSAQFVRECFPSVRVVEAHPNLGFAAGNNVGMREALGHYVVLLNNDTSVRPGWLAALVDTADRHPEAGAVTAKLVFRDHPDVIQNAGSLLLSDGSGADRGFHERDTGQYEREEEVFGACGASALYRREMLQQVGLFDETFFMYYEDTDLNWRMRLAGWTVVYQPAAVVDHVHAGSSGEWSPFFTFHVDRNRLFMILKNAAPALVSTSFASFAERAAKNAARAALSRVVKPPPTLQKANLGAGRALVHLKVARSFLLHAPEMLCKRREIRAHRKVADADVECWFYPKELWDARSA